MALGGEMRSAKIRTCDALKQRARFLQQMNGRDERGKGALGKRTPNGRVRCVRRTRVPIRTARLQEDGLEIMAGEGSRTRRWVWRQWRQMGRVQRGIRGSGGGARGAVPASDPCFKFTTEECLRTTQEKVGESRINWLSLLNTFLFKGNFISLPQMENSYHLL